jgi:hypothetical protein
MMVRVTSDSANVAHYVYHESILPTSHDEAGLRKRWGIRVLAPIMQNAPGRKIGTAYMYFSRIPHDQITRLSANFDKLAALGPVPVQIFF